MRIDFHPNFGGLKFKPEEFRRMMRGVMRALSYILAAVGLGLLVLKLLGI
jgi:hypothetical protein